MIGRWEPTWSGSPSEWWCHRRSPTETHTRNETQRCPQAGRRSERWGHRGNGLWHLPGAVGMGSTGGRQQRTSPRAERRASWRGGPPGPPARQSWAGAGSGPRAALLSGRLGSTASGMPGVPRGGGLGTQGVGCRGAAHLQHCWGAATVSSTGHWGSRWGAHAMGYCGAQGLGGQGGAWATGRLGGGRGCGAANNM